MIDQEQKEKEKTFKRILEYSIVGTTIAFSVMIIDAVILRSISIFLAYLICVLEYGVYLMNYYLTFKRKVLTLRYSIINYISTFLIIIIFFTYFGGGFAGSMISLYFIIILTSTLLLETNEAILISIGIIITYLLFVSGETYGILVPLENNVTIIKYSKALSDLISFIIVTFLITIISQNTKDSISFYKLRSIRLSSIRKRLEVLVRRRTNQLEESNKVIRKRTEQLERSNRELKRAREELDKSYKSLQKLDVEKDNFISIAAHELKTPLTAIGGYAQLLKNSKVVKNEKKRRQFLDILDRESKRLSELVTEILNLSRIDLGVMRYTFGEVNVNEVMKNIEDEFSSKIEEKGLEYVFKIDKNLPAIITDIDRLQEILTNLLTNAIKYTPRGKITVSVVKKKDHVLFSIADTGIGIARKDFKKIFKRFSQIDSSLRREVGGTGLGLSICKEYIDKLGGDIWLKSKLGRGSTFYVSLPLEPRTKLNIRKNLNDVR